MIVLLNVLIPVKILFSDKPALLLILFDKFVNDVDKFLVNPYKQLISAALILISLTLKILVKLIKSKLL